MASLGFNDSDSDEEEEEGFDYYSSTFSTTNKKLKSEPPFIESSSSVGGGVSGLGMVTSGGIVVNRFGRGRGIARHTHTLDDEDEEASPSPDEVRGRGRGRPRGRFIRSNQLSADEENRDWIGLGKGQEATSEEGWRQEIASSSIATCTVVEGPVTATTRVDQQTLQSKEHVHGTPCSSPLAEKEPGENATSQVDNVIGGERQKFNLPQSQPITDRVPEQISNCDYILLHSMAKNNQIELIPHVNFAKAELGYRTIKQAWNMAYTDEVISRECKRAYNDCMNPFALGLFFMMRSYDFSNPQSNKTLCSSVIVELKKFLSYTSSESHLSKDIQMLAFHLVLTYRKMDLKNLVVAVFKLKDVQDDLLEEIKLLSELCLFKEALSGALALEAFNVDIHTFLVPMILQDRLNYVEEYFNHSDSRQLLQELMCFLDQIASERNIDHWLYNYAADRKIDMKTIQQEKFKGRTLTKLVKRFATKYKIDPVAFPKTRNRQKLAELRYIFHRKYTEDTSDMTNENFQEIVADVIKGDYMLTEEALYLMKVHAGHQDTVDFAKLYNIPSNWLSPDISHMLQNTPTIEAVQEKWEDEDWETENSGKPTSTVKICDVPPNRSVVKELIVSELAETPSTFISSNYYTIPDGLEIKMVSNLDEFQFFMGHLREELTNKHVVVVGVDSEWKPVLSCNFASLLQLAFDKKIFLVDLLMLEKIELDGVSSFVYLLSEFFASERVIKLGYDIRNDFKMLCARSPHWINLKEKSKSILDLKNLHMEILKRNSKFFPFQEMSTERGLSELVQICCSKSLHKGEQFSDWERRPLKNVQVVYAAADAYCLLEIFRVIKERDTIFPIGLDNIIKACQNQMPEKSNCQKLRSPIEVVHAVFCDNNEDKERQGSSKTAPTVNSILCDGMLEGLGRLLRSFGFSTVIVGKGSSDSDEALIMSAKAMGALVITRGKVRYNDFLLDFSPDQVLYVKSDNYPDQVQEVLDYFGITAEKQYCHSICYHCNSNVFIKSSKAFIQKLLERRGYNRSRMLTKQALEKILQRVPAEMIIYMKDSERKWCFRPEEDIVIRPSEDRLAYIAFTPEGVPVEIKKIPPHLLDLYMDDFYVCNFCGSCYWSSIEIENMYFTSGAQEMLSDTNSGEILLKATDGNHSI